MRQSGKNIRPDREPPEDFLADPDFLRLTTQISLAFVRASAGEIDAAINDSLALCAEFFKADRAYVLLFNDRQHTASNTHEYYAAGIEPRMKAVQNIPLSAFPWFFRKILMQEPVVVSSLTVLPAGAEAEKAEFTRQSIQSLLCLPLLTGDNPLGFWGMDMVRSKVCWSGEQLAQAAIMAEIIAGAVNRRRAGNTLNHIREWLENVQRIAHLGGWKWEIPDNLLFWSDEVYRIFGLKPQEFAASYEAFLACVHPGDRAMIEQTVQAAFNERKPYEIEHRIRRPDGETRWVLERAEVVRDQAGNPMRMSGTVQDITERKVLENQLVQAQKMESLGVMAGGIAHDFNNILTPVIMYSQMLLKEAREGGVAHQYLTQILTAGERARSLVRRILDFSRNGQHEPQPVRLGKVVTEALELLRAGIPAAIELDCRIETEDDLVLADRTQMLQVLMNLILNAAQAMDGKEGGVVITLSAIAGQDSTRPLPPQTAGKFRLRLTVSDSGHGIPASLLGRVFEPYFTTKGQGVGTGLGLAVTHGIIEKHGGIISVASEPGQGTTFEVLLPALGGVSHTNRPRE